MSWLTEALTRLAAPQCVLCHSATLWQDRVCPVCERAFAALTAEHVQYATPAGLDNLWSAVPYAGAVQGWVAAVKSGRSILAAEALADRLALYYMPAPDDAASQRWVVPIALPARRWVTRGFNQAHVLARALVRAHGGSLHTILRTSPWRGSLSQQSKAQRLASRHNFTLASVPTSVSPATIWLVDDVVTNGTTLQRAAQVLRARWPHARLYGITLARTPPL